MHVVVYLACRRLDTIINHRLNLHDRHFEIALPLTSSLLLSRSTQTCQG